MSLEAIAAGLGLTVKKIVQSTEPITEKVDIYSKSLNKNIEKGLVLGRSQITEVVTQQGIKFIGEEVSKIYSPDETDQNKWQIIKMGRRNRLMNPWG